MNELHHIKTSLESNPEVTIVDVIEVMYLPNTSQRVVQTVDYIVVPKQGLYTANELQEFMRRLVPDLKPYMKDEFRPYEKFFELGKLCFEEKFGEEQVTRICTITDEPLADKIGFVEGKRTIEETRDYLRRIWVKPFPDERLAKRLGPYVHECSRLGYDVIKEHLKEQQPTPSVSPRKKRIASLVGWLRQ